MKHSLVRAINILAEKEMTGSEKILGYYHFDNALFILKKEITTMKYKVFISSQNMHEILFETDSEKEALNFCEQNHWELRDENEFVWNLYYEKA